MSPIGQKTQNTYLFIYMENMCFTQRKRAQSSVPSSRTREHQKMTETELLVSTGTHADSCKPLKGSRDGSAAPELLLLKAKRCE